MSTAAIVGLILLGILVGAIVPVLYRAAQTLKSARRQIDALGPRVDHALQELTDVTARLNRIATTIESQTDRLRPVVDHVVGIGQTLGQVRKSVHRFSSVAGAVGPALFAGLSAFWARRQTRPAGAEPTETEDDTKDQELGRNLSSDPPGSEPPNTRAAVSEDRYEY
jgi:uncharacterized protein YoxC